MNFPITVTVKDKGLETFDQNSYIAAGGQGTVCKKGSLAYKIYHDPARMIPVKKIQELQALAHIDSVLGPRDILLDKKGNTPIGFTMPYKKDTEFITRLFNKNYRNDKGITPEMIVDLVKKFQLTVSEIHKNNILIVDLNELNFLTNIDIFDLIYFIDVDSYQTPSFHASALMESVRDRTMKQKNQFSEGTDWYSFAIVSFMLYLTYHPYQKGKHPKYNPNDWSIRMDKGLSVFHPDITLVGPWKDFSPIPAPHLDWYKQVFYNGVRTAPPMPDGVILSGPVQPTLIVGNEGFVVKKLGDFPDNILCHYFLSGKNYILTKKALYSSVAKIHDLPSNMNSVSLADVPGLRPILVTKSHDTVSFDDLDGNNIRKIAAMDAMQYRGLIYTIYNNKMTENNFTYMGGNILHSSKIISNIFAPATKLFPGVAIQDILQTCWVSIPYEKGKCFYNKIPELDKQRIIEAKFDYRILMVITESDGVYNRYIFVFDQKMNNYTCRKDEKINYVSLNFTCLTSGICIHLPCDDYVEVFRTVDKVKKIDNPPITSDVRLSNDLTGVLFFNKKEFYNLSLK